MKLAARILRKSLSIGPSSLSKPTSRSSRIVTSIVSLMMPRYSAAPTTPQSVNPVNVPPMSYGNDTPPQLPRGVHPTLVASPSGLSLNRPMPPPEAITPRPVDVAQPQKPTTQNPRSHNSGGQGSKAAFGNTSIDVEHPPTTTKHQRPKPMSTPLSTLGTFTNPPLASNVSLFRTEAVNSCAAPPAERRTVTNKRVKQAESTPMLAVQPQNGECMAIDRVSDLDHSVLPSLPVASPTHEPRLPPRKPPQSALLELFQRIDDLKAMIKDAESLEQRQMYQGKLDNFLAKSHQILCPRPSVFKMQPSRGTPVVTATSCHDPKPNALPPHSSNSRKVTLWPSASSHIPDDPLKASSPISSSTPLALVEPDRPRPRTGKKKVASMAKGKACGEQMLVDNLPDVRRESDPLATKQPVACPSRRLTNYSEVQSEGMSTPLPVITSFRDAKKTPKLLRDLKQLKVLRDKIEGILDGPHPPPLSDFELQSYPHSGTPVLPLTAPHSAMHSIAPPWSAKDPKTMKSALEKFAISRKGDVGSDPTTKQMNAKKKTTSRQSTSLAQRNDGSFDALANSGDAPASSSVVPMQRSMSGHVLSSSKSFSLHASQAETSLALSEGSQKINGASKRTRKNYAMSILPDAEMQIEIESASFEADYVAEMDALLGNAFLLGDSQNMSSTDDLSTVFSPYGPTYHQDGDPVVDYEYDDILQFPLPFLNAYQRQDQSFFGSFPGTPSSSESANDTFPLHTDDQLFSLDRPTEEFNPLGIDSSGSFGHRPQIEGNETTASILPIESEPTISEIVDTSIPFRRTEESNVDSSGSFNMNETTVQQSPVGSVNLVPQPLASSKPLQFSSNSTSQVPPLDSSQLGGSRALDATGSLTHETITDRKSNNKQPQESIDSGGTSLASSALSDIPTIAATGVNNVNASTWLVKTNRSGSALQYNTDTAGLVFALGKNNESRRVKVQAVPSSFDSLHLGVDPTNTTQGSPRADAQTEDQKGDAGASTASSPLPGEHTLPEPGPNPPHMPPPVYIPTRSKYAHSGPEQWRFSSFPAPKVTLEVQDVEMVDDELKEEDIPVASGQTPYVHTVQVVDDPIPMDVDVPEVNMLFDTSEDNACFHCSDVDIEMADAEEITYLSLIDIEMDDDTTTAYSPGVSPALTSHMGPLWGAGQLPSVAGSIEFAGSFVFGNIVICPSRTPEEPVEMDVVLEDNLSTGKSHEKDAVPESPGRMAPKEDDQEGAFGSSAQDSEKECLSGGDELAPTPPRLARNGAFDSASASPKKIESFNCVDEIFKPCGLCPEISYTEKSPKTSSVSDIPEEQPKHKADPSKQKNGAFASQTIAFKASYHRPARKTQKAALSIPKLAEVDHSPTTLRSVYRKALNGPLLGSRVVEVAEQCESRGLSGPTLDETTSSINSATIDPENELHIPGAYPEYPSSEPAGYRGFIYTWFQTTFRAALHRCL